MESGIFFFVHCCCRSYYCHHYQIGKHDYHCYNSSHHYLLPHSHLHQTNYRHFGFRLLRHYLLPHNTFGHQHLSYPVYLYSQVLSPCQPRMNPKYVSYHPFLLKLYDSVSFCTPLRSQHLNGPSDGQKGLPLDCAEQPKLFHLYLHLDKQAHHRHRMKSRKLLPLKMVNLR